MEVLKQILAVLIRIKDGFLTVVDFVSNVFQTLRFGFQSLTIGIINVAKDVLGDLGGLIYYGWESVGELIGGPATVIIASMLVIIMVRIVIAFVFKIFRLNIDYNTFDKNTRKANSWSNSSEYHKRSATRG